MKFSIPWNDAHFQAYLLDGVSLTKKRNQGRSQAVIGPSNFRSFDYKL